VAVKRETTQTAEAPKTVPAPTEILATPEIPVKKETPNFDGPNVSAFSLASIRAKKALEESSKNFVKPVNYTVLPTELFTETEMLIQWNNYAKKLGEKGYRIMESLLMINDPKLNAGTAITIELPNEGSKLDFESEKIGLLGHLRGHLHNHDITIEVIVNETMQNKRNLNDQDRYNRLLELNPNIELLRNTFGLDVNA
jgi:DNA polymerase-3 subunit gamma/tau